MLGSETLTCKSSNLLARRDTYLFRRNNKRPVSAKQREDGSVDEKRVVNVPQYPCHLSPHCVRPIGIRCADKRFEFKPSGNTVRTPTLSYLTV